MNTKLVVELLLDDPDTTSLSCDINFLLAAVDQAVAKETFHCMKEDEYETFCENKAGEILTGTVEDKYGNTGTWTLSVPKEPTKLSISLPLPLFKVDDKVVYSEKPNHVAIVTEIEITPTIKDAGQGFIPYTFEYSYFVSDGSSYSKFWEHELRAAKGSSDVD